MKMIVINKHSSKLIFWSIEMPNAPYLNRCAAYEKRANTQIAHLIFVDTQNANPKKPKELFCSQRSIER
jgi:hypothetical protein